jgi:hypothetical protein
MGLDVRKDRLSGTDLYDLQFSWPKKFLSSGLIEVRGLADEKILFSVSVDPSKVQDFLTSSENAHSVMTADQGFFEPKIHGADLARWDKVPFRFCMKNSDQDLLKSFCSKPYILSQDSNLYVIKDFLALRRKHSKDQEIPRKNMTSDRSTSHLNLSFYSPLDPSKIQSLELP